jgi:uncharacterized protein YabE (DUF348 family)
MFRKLLLGVAGAGFSIVVIGLVVGLIPPPKHVLADSTRIVSIYHDGEKKVITTDATTVGDALKQSGVSLTDGDTVEPNPGTAMPVGFFNINVYRARPVAVIDGDQQRVVRTASQSPRLIAESAGYTVYPEDEYDMATIDDMLSHGAVGQQVVIRRSTPVVIETDGQRYVVRTQQKTVGGLLDERDVALGPEDTTEPARGTVVSANITVKINRVKIAVVKQALPIARSTQTIKDATLNAGDARVETEGSDGEKVMTFRINYQNGIERHRDLLTQEVTKEPVAKVVRVGTKIDYSADPVALGKQMAAARGWVGDQWTALYSLWDHESGWNPNSKNFWSGACGIPQAYPCSKITDKSVAGQIRWGLDYIANKYGNPVNAWAYWKQNNSY